MSSRPLPYRLEPTGLGTLAELAADPNRRGGVDTTYMANRRSINEFISAGTVPGDELMGEPGRVDVTERGTRRILIVAAVMAAALMQTLDSTITNVALPTVQGNLGASQDEGTWIVTAYTIAGIIIIPMTPWLQNRFGRRRYFVASIAGFTLASLVCGAAQDLSLLIGARVVQGAFGGGLLATGQAILRDTFPPKQLGLSQGIFALGAIMGPALGPPLGGVLVDNYSWNWVFDINVVPGVFSSVILYVMLKDPVTVRSTNIDFGGIALLAIGLGTMQYVLTEGERNDWLSSAMVTGALIVMIVALLGFVLWELRVRDPIVDLRILRNRTVAAGTVLALSLGGAIFGSTYTLPQFTQGPLGFTPTLSGMLFILRAVPIFFVTPALVRLTGKVDARVLLAIGFAAIALGSILQARITTPMAHFTSFTLALIVTGIGAACLFVPLSIAVLGATSPTDGPKAGAFINLATQLGGSLAVAGLDVIIDRRASFHSTVLDGSATAGRHEVASYLAHASHAQLARAIEAQSIILSYADATLAIAALCVCSAPLILFMRKANQASAPIDVAL